MCRNANTPLMGERSEFCDLFWSSLCPLKWVVSMQLRIPLIITSMPCFPKLQGIRVLPFKSMVPCSPAQICAILHGTENNFRFSNLDLWTLKLYPNKGTSDNLSEEEYTQYIEWNCNEQGAFMNDPDYSESSGIPSTIDSKSDDLEEEQVHDSISISNLCMRCHYIVMPPWAEIVCYMERELRKQD